MNQIKDNLHPRFRPFCLFPLVSIFVCLLYIVIGGLNGFGTIWAAKDSSINFIFVLLILLLAIFTFFDVFLRHGVSHILVILLNGLLVSAFALTKMIYRFGTGDYAAAVFYLLGLLASIGALVFYVMKALDGDADWRFWLLAGLTVLFLLFAGVGEYALMDAYAHLGDSPFWGGIVITRLVLFTSILATAFSNKYDYDPVLVALDEFGNPIKDDVDGGKKESAPIDDTKGIDLTGQDK